MAETETVKASYTTLGVETYRLVERGSNRCHSNHLTDYG